MCTSTSYKINLCLFFPCWDNCMSMISILEELMLRTFCLGFLEAKAVFALKLEKMPPMWLTVTYDSV
jgi:hypothetical protein